MSRPFSFNPIIIPVKRQIIPALVLARDMDAQRDVVDTINLERRDLLEMGNVGNWWKQTMAR